MHFTGTKSSPYIFLLLKHKNIKLEWRIPNYCINHLIKLTLYDETEKRAHDSQIVRAKENHNITLSSDVDQDTKMFGLHENPLAYQCIIY